eukprot:3932939-Rhodomonas_salina.4
MFLLLCAIGQRFCCAVCAPRGLYLQQCVQCVSCFPDLKTRKLSRRDQAGVRTEPKTVEMAQEVLRHDEAGHPVFRYPILPKAAGKLAKAASMCCAELFVLLRRNGCSANM